MLTEAGAKAEAEAKRERRAVVTFMLIVIIDVMCVWVDFCAPFRRRCLLATHAPASMRDGRTIPGLHTRYLREVDST